MNRKKHGLIKSIKEETGQTLVMVMVLLVLGSLMLPPLLAFMSTSLKNEGVYDSKSDSLYAADAGVEDAVWQIKYDGLEALSGDSNYNYDFTSNWTYELNNPVNGLTVNVTISNVWLPSNVTLSGLGLTAAGAKAILERDITDNTTNRLLVTGTPLDEDYYRIKLDFYPSENETSALEVASIGIWLPQGFTYDGGCNMETYAGTMYKYVETVEDRPGGQAVLWDFAAIGPMLFDDLPPAPDYITFKYASSDTSVRPAAVPWFVTSGNITTDIPMVWDIDSRYYQVTSAAGDTSIEAYASRSEMRNLYAAISGDYVAIGNSLMTDDYHDSWDIRDTWHEYKDYNLDTNPEDATVTRAYLYWSGFFESGFSSADYWGPDNCNDFDDWDGPNKWWHLQTSGDRCFYVYKGSSGTDTRYLKMDLDPEGCFDLDGYPVGTTIVEWQQWENESIFWPEDNLEEDDALKFQFSSDNGTTWSEEITAFSGDIGGSKQYYYYVIPEEYLAEQFKIKFYVTGCTTSGEDFYIDNIAIARITGTADTVAMFKIEGYDTYSEDVSALESQVLGNKEKGQYSFACWQDVTDLVKAHCERGPSENPTGNAKYTVGYVDSDDDQLLSYCGWSLIIIYHSPATAGRQLYLWNTFSYSPGGGVNLDFDGDGDPGGHITGFIVPERIEGEDVCAKLTCFVGEGDECWSPDTLEFNGFELWDGTTTDDNYEGYAKNVWNAESVDMQNGIDIDTFTIYWDDGVLHADDTEAQIDLESAQDNFNLIYIILSVRSVTTVSGTTHYVING